MKFTSQQMEKKKLKNQRSREVGNAETVFKIVAKSSDSLLRSQSDHSH